MPQNLPELLLRQLSVLAAQQFGLHFPEDRWRELERGLASAAREFDRGDAESCLRWLLSSPLTREQIEILGSHLTIGETYFFREPSTFEALENHLLPDLIQSRRDSGKKWLRIWSAGCATGEEPYSIAILLHRLLGDEEKDWNLTLLATDISLRALRKAAEGVYGEWSFRNAPMGIKARYFRGLEKRRYTILPSIREKVSFAYHNLLQDPYPSVLNNTNAMDLILCRNVLMYFTPECAARVVRNLHDCLLDDGWLVISPVEVSAIPAPEFSRNALSAAILRKETPASGILEAVRPEDAPELPEPMIEPPPRDTRTSFGHAAATTPRPYGLKKQPPPLPAARPRPILPPGPPELPDDAESLTRLAKLYADQGDLDQALDYCQRAADLGELKPEQHYLLASILQEQGRVKEARNALRRTLYLDPNFVLAHVALAHLAKRERKPRQARKHAEQALALLQTYSREAILPWSEGLTAGRLVEFIQALE